MSLLYNFNNDPSNQSLTQKPKKIYLLHTWKTYNTNRKKLNQLVQINSQAIQQTPQLPLNGSIKRYLTTQKTQSDSLRKSSHQRPRQFNIWEKKNQLKPNIVQDTDFQTINLQSSNDSVQKLRHHNSLRINFTKQQHSPDFQLFKIQQSCGNLPSLIKRQKNSQISPKKKNSCPNPQHKRSISFSNENNDTPMRLRQRKNILQEQSSVKQWGQIGFLKNGKVNGHKIYNLVRKQRQNKQILRLETNQADSNKKDHFQSAKRIIQKYYSLIKNTDYGRMTKHSGNKVIRNHFQTLQEKKNYHEKKPSRIDHIHVQTFIKVQAMFQKKQDVGR